MIRNIFKYFIFALIGIIVALVFVPYLFKDDLLANLKALLNEEVNAQVDFKDLDISLIRSFPELQVKLLDASVYNNAPFDKGLLFKAESILVTTPIGMLFSDEISVEINALEINKGTFNIVVNKDGKANYDIIPSTDEGGEAIGINFEKYALNDCQLQYSNYSNKTNFSAASINHQGSGNFFNNVFDLNTTNNIEGIDLSIDNLKYLNSAKINGDIVLAIDNNKSDYTIKKGQVLLNELPLTISGTTALRTTSTNLDLDIKSEAASFAQLLSLIPNSYKGDLSKVTSKGIASFEGHIKGSLDETKGLSPNYDFDIKVKDGFVKYPDLPESIANADANISYVSKGSNYKISIPKFSFDIGGDPVNGSLIYDNSPSDALIKSKVVSNINLAKIQKAFPLSGTKVLAGQLKSDLFIDAKMSDIETANYDAIDFKGDASLNKFVYQSTDYPEIKADQLQMTASPERLRIHRSNIALGKSDLELNGDIENPLAYFSENVFMAGDINLKSDYINANEWINTEASSVATTPNQEIDAIVKNSGVHLNASIKQLDYDMYELKDNEINLNFQDDRLEIKKYKATVYDNDFSLDGQLEGLYDYTLYNKPLNGNLNFKAQEFNTNPFLKTSNKQAATEAFKVPEMIDLLVQTDIKKMIYGDLILKEFKASLDIADQKIDFKKVITESLGGQMKLDGHYDSSTENPEFKVNYDLSNIRFDEAYSSLNIVKKLAPIMNFVDGKFNSTLSMEGNLDNKMELLLNSLDASGFVQTVHGVINKLKPLNKLGEKLGVGNIEPLDISESKNWFEIKKGLVELKPQTYSKGNMSMEISGSHSFNQDMDYSMIAVIPRAELSKSTAGKVADSGLKWIEKEAGKLGLDLNQGENIKLNIGIAGSLLQPKFSITPMGSEGKSLEDQAKQEVKDKIDSTKAEIKDKINEEIDQAKDSLDQVVTSTVDTLSKKVDQEIDTITTKIKDKVKDEIKTKIDTIVGETVGNAIDSLVDDKIKDVLGDKAKDVLGDKAKEEADKIKDKLKDLNPFGKKK